MIIFVYILTTISLVTLLAFCDMFFKSIKNRIVLKKQKETIIKLIYNFENCLKCKDRKYNDPCNLCGNYKFIKQLKMELYFYE